MKKPVIWTPKRVPFEHQYSGDIKGLPPDKVAILGTTRYYTEHGGTNPRGMKTTPFLGFQKFPQTATFSFLANKAAWKHGGIFHSDPEVDELLATAPWELNVVPVDLPTYERRSQRYWLRILHRYMRWEQNRTQRRLERNAKYFRNKIAVCQNRLYMFLYNKAAWDHGGIYHDNRNVNNLISSSAYLTYAIEIPPAKYERPRQRMWLTLFHLYRRIKGVAK